ncbi:hypothetical protein HYPSUDRAFT_54529 [Hypholoma sublateritium FD-334 SS-4]|uniref:N-acetyltransferase domain-containing protein n=1 Tax=Hypholoma sublateritium (strain FD-334 SS-4) TaxID=945553 RepID=A0A0D2MHH3_HYPSF|nr:hypothetical protein HYPSUDRAFT_54529 [Hypholoma sublateritium FD-334 SS-4]
MFINSYKPPALDTTADGSFAEPYDLNSSIPVPALLETTRVQLVPFTPALHAQLFADELAKDAAAVSRYLPMSWSSLADVLHFAETVIRRDPTATLFAIIDKTRPPAEGDGAAAPVPAGRIAGVIGWVHGSVQNRALELAPVVVLPAFQRTFVSANAIGLLLKYALDAPAAGGLGFRRVAWSANPLNVASIGAAEKMGFVREGVMRWSWVLPPGKEGNVVHEDEERGSGNGRDSVVLSLCWDRWISGARDVVVARMERV